MEDVLKKVSVEDILRTELLDFVTENLYVGRGGGGTSGGVRGVGWEKKRQGYRK